MPPVNSLPSNTTATCLRIPKRLKRIAMPWAFGLWKAHAVKLFRKFISKLNPEPDFVPCSRKHSLLTEFGLMLTYEPGCWVHVTQQVKVSRLALTYGPAQLRTIST